MKPPVGNRPWFEFIRSRHYGRDARCRQPDIEEFIKIKADFERSEGAVYTTHVYPFDKEPMFNKVLYKERVGNLPEFLEEIYLKTEEGLRSQYNLKITCLNLCHRGEKNRDASW